MDFIYYLLLTPLMREELQRNRIHAQNSDPFIGSMHIPETVVEEKIETICTKDHLEQVLEAIKTAHPYESTYIDIRPIYKQGCKFPK